MATLYVTELDELAYDRTTESVLCGKVPGLVEQAVAIGAGSTTSNPFNVRTKFIMVHNDASCCLAFGDNPTAVVGYHRLAANERLFYGVKQGQQVAVIAST